MSYSGNTESEGYGGAGKEEFTVHTGGEETSFRIEPGGESEPVQVDLEELLEGQEEIQGELKEVISGLDETYNSIQELEEDIEEGFIEIEDTLTGEHEKTRDYLEDIESLLETETSQPEDNLINVYGPQSILGKIGGWIGREKTDRGPYDDEEEKKWRKTGEEAVNENARLSRRGSFLGGAALLLGIYATYEHLNDDQSNGDKDPNGSPVNGNGNGKENGYQDIVCEYEGEAIEVTDEDLDELANSLGEEHPDLEEELRNHANHGGFNPGSENEIVYDEGALIVIYNDGTPAYEQNIRDEDFIKILNELGYNEDTECIDEY